MKFTDSPLIHTLTVKVVSLEFELFFSSFQDIYCTVNITKQYNVQTDKTQNTRCAKFESIKYQLTKQSKNWLKQHWLCIANREKPTFSG